MNAPLTHFALTAAWLWLQLVALGAVYIARVPGATRQAPAAIDVAAPPTAKPPEGTPQPALPVETEPKTVEVAAKPPEVVTPPPANPPPQPPAPPVSPKGQLPDGVNWAAGEVLLLVVAANFTTTERGLLRNEVDKLVDDMPGAVVGGTAFVCDRGAAWGLASAGGPSGAEPFRTDQPADFAEAFAQVARVEAAVRRVRTRPATVVVLWHGLRAPPLREFPAATRRLLPGKFAGTLVWSGTALEADAVPDSVLKLYDARTIALHGRDLTGLAGTVANGLRLTPPTPREGDR